MQRSDFMENWQDEVEQRDLWLLNAEQLALLPGMTDTGRMYFPIQLKFIELYDRFPEDNRQINTDVAQALAKQLSVPIDAIASYDPCSRQVQRHRRAIRDFLGYRPSTGADLKQLFHWLCHEALPLDPLARHGRDVAFDWYRTQRIGFCRINGHRPAKVGVADYLGSQQIKLFRR
ncbi:DUF4158 domain-containing protein [Serratia sp. T13T92]|uniref:DUF4158 domain-containing protein n=1 Tax=Serratia sp. T13T92 TaxID=3397496 RepID=UPI0039E0B1F8